MGTVTQAFAKRAQEFGADIVCNAAVQSVEIQNGEKRGVVLANGTRINATCGNFKRRIHIQLCLSGFECVQ